MSPREATIKSMGEIQIALIAIALVLSAVFLPMAFFGGSVGVIYRQFSITIVSSMVLSVIVALVLSPGAGRDPAQAARARSSHERQRAPCPASASARVGGAASTAGSPASSRPLSDAASRRGRSHSALVAAGLCRCSRSLLVVLFFRLPTSFLPAEDQGAAQLQYTLPPGATQARTLAVARRRSSIIS